MKIVGLNIGNGRLGVTVLQRKFGKNELVDSFVQTYGNDEELAAILRERSGEWTGSQIITSIPGRFFTQRPISFPFADRKRIEKALPFEMEDLVPFELEDVVLDHLALAAGSEKEHGAQVLCMALPKTVLRKHLDLLAGAGIDPQAVVPSFAGLATVAAMIPAEGTTLLLNGSDVCLRSGGTVQAVRSISASSSGGIRQVLQSLETGLKERIERAVVLSAEDGIGSFLAEEGIASEQIVPELGGKKVSEPGSLGTALAAGVNFRKDEFAYRAADEGARRMRRRLIIAAGITALLFAVNIGVKMGIVRSGYGKLDAEIRAVYKQTFPDAPPPGDPVRQMRDKLAEAKRTFGALGSSTSALDIMKTVTDGIPKEVRVSFNDFLLEGDHLKLQGETGSFEAVDKLKAELAKSPLFTDVAVQDTRMGVDNKVKFRLEIKLKQAM